MPSISEKDLEKENVVDCCRVVAAFIGQRLGEMLVGKKRVETKHEGPMYISGAEAMRQFGIQKRTLSAWKKDPNAPQTNRLNKYSVEELERYLEPGTKE